MLAWCSVVPWYCKECIWKCQAGFSEDEEVEPGAEGGIEGQNCEIAESWHHFSSSTFWLGQPSGNCAKEGRKVEGLCGLQALECCNQKKPLSFTASGWHHGLSGRPPDVQFMWWIGYFQIAIALEDQVKTTFITPWGCFYYRRMPFGLMNAPAHYQEMAPFLDKFAEFLLMTLLRFAAPKGAQRGAPKAPPRGGSQRG